MANPEITTLSARRLWAGAFEKVAERRVFVEDPQTPTNGKLGLQASLFLHYKTHA
jgi:hypothetical protein